MFTNCFHCFSYTRDMKSAFNLRLIFHVLRWNINPKWFPKFPILLPISLFLTEVFMPEVFKILWSLFSSMSFRSHMLKGNCIELYRGLICLCYFNLTEIYSEEHILGTWEV